MSPKRDNLPRRQILLLAVLPAVAPKNTSAKMSPKLQKVVLQDSGKFPNSPLPALVYRHALQAADLASAFEERFASNGWGGSWRNGLFSVHHYHSTAHEVLGVYSGSVKVRLGGESGALVELQAGDVAVLPAGVAHKNEGQSSDFRVVGAYPAGTSPDMKYGEAGERPRADENIARVARPKLDPVHGVHGPLVELWRG